MCLTENLTYQGKGTITTWWLNGERQGDVTEQKEQERSRGGVAKDQDSGAINNLQRGAPTRRAYEPNQVLPPEDKQLRSVGMSDVIPLTVGVMQSYNGSANHVTDRQSGLDQSQEVAAETDRLLDPRC